MPDPTCLDQNPPAKTTLFCPACDHASARDGDWSEQERRVDGRHERVLACPNCGTSVVSQPVLATPA